MPATNYTPIQLYRSTTSGNVPSAANLSAGEIALNIADNDMTMYFENASGTVKRFFNNPAALKYPTADGTSGQFLTTNGAGVLSFGSVTGGPLTNNTRQAVTSSATTTINLNSGNVVDLTMAANITTLSFTNVPASGTPILVQIVVKNASDGTAYTIVWPNSVYWSGQYSATSAGLVQTAPTLATGANGVTVIALLTTDGGTKWRGWVEATIPGSIGPQLWSWGANSAGELGTNTTNIRSSPVQIGALANWASFYLGTNFCAAVKTDGTLWSWGAGTSGRLGLNNTTNYSSPKQIGALTTWSKVGGSNDGAQAVKTDGTLWSWGKNNVGQLGLGDTIYRSSPVQIGALTDWATPGKSFGLFNGCIKTDGTLWMWGRNGAGQLGIDASGYRSSPVQVTTLTNWAKLAGSFGLTTTGDLYTWGLGQSGASGQNTTAPISSPTLLGSAGQWVDVGTCENGGGSAIRTDGTLWSWGFNLYGQLGTNNTTYRSSPVQVGTLTNWASVSYTTVNSNFAIDTSGRLYAFGRNDSGTLGDGTTIDRSSPVQVGTGTVWSRVTSCGSGATIARAINAVNPA